ncbi:hypothetical protein [Streptomyces sp. VRA16 Mangrove soil]|uniref:hypothetical protein n=1 Tax=Streptomyces sp. VRA16 Mangrove soil TaxID=2817434 RepID=UPI001A9FF588|nr:hypothetical protein [Streptomyces sp. VRA16 Mangrove soil]MBO1336303.1 hypothetical protein [Streptomyces sp. VRA16 Mangrove soil]
MAANPSCPLRRGPAHREGNLDFSWAGKPLATDPYTGNRYAFAGGNPIWWVRTLGRPVGSCCREEAKGMAVLFETWSPTYERRTVSVQEAVQAYRELPVNTSAAFSWNDCEEECLIVGVEPEFSTVTMGRDRSFWNLRISEDDEPVEIRLGADDHMWPRGCVLPRDMGLELLLKVDEFDSLFHEYSWAEG